LILLLYGRSRARFTLYFEEEDRMNPSKSETFTFKLSRRDREALDLLAKSEGENRSVVVRRLIRREADRHGVLPPPPEMTSYQGQQAGGQR
jgi:hypothetical protein